jgi:NADH-quinone oxidoreductase subunit G
VATIYVENKPYEVPDDQNLLHACLSLGFDIPYFCWHPAMHSVGACRLCAVTQFADENDTKGKIVMSCMTFAKEGTRISIEHPDAVRFRKAVMEWLMLNHPHDCPVCDEGGECHLQDMTQMCGHVYRRTRFKKRTHRNQDLGPFITHEMNRCIQCYRCVRFYIDYAGGRDLDVFGWHNHVYFGRHQDGVLQSKFSGNLVEVCPTGVFDDKTFAKHFTRKWDLQTAPSVCVHCGLGCNTVPGERYGVLRRIRNRYNGDVNGYFLCDRGRFGYDFVNSPQRIKDPLTRDAEGRFAPLATEDALKEVGRLVKDSERLIGIGSARASLESNFALRTLVGPENFYIGMTDADVQLLSVVTEILHKGPVPSASLSEVGLADAVLILGEDVSNAAPMLELSLRRSILRKPSAIARELHIALWNDAAVRAALQTEKRGPLFIATTHGTDLDAAATATYHAAPQDIARLGYAVANKLDANSPSVPGLPAQIDSLAQQIADQLAGSEHPLILSGSGCGSSSVIEAAANVALALHGKNERARICFAVPWCNSMGLGLMGCRSIDAAIHAIKSGKSATIIILEDNIYRHLDTAQADGLLHAANQVVSIDSVHHQTTAKSLFVLPAATFAESTGTFVNNEGRAQRFFRVFNPSGAVQDSWRWIGDIMLASGKSDSPPWPTYDDIVASLAQEMSVFAPTVRVSPPASFRIDDQLIPRQSHRYSGRTAENADVTVHEPQTPPDPDSPLSFSMEGYDGQPPPSLIPEFWAPKWNSVQSVNKYQEGVGGPLRGGNPGIRLIEPHGGPGHAYFTHIPPAFVRREGCLLIVPGYHIFGSEELSVLSPAVAELVAKPSIAVSPEDIGSLMVDENGLVELAFSHISHYLPARLDPGLPPGLAVVPMGLPGLEWNGLPVWKKLLH